jgi:hypothetical protein
VKFPALMLPVMLQRFIDSQAIKPGLKSRVTSKLIHFAKHLKKDLLCQIGSVLQTNHSNHEPEDALMTAFIQFTLCAALPTTASRQQVCADIRLGLCHPRSCPLGCRHRGHSS